MKNYPKCPGDIYYNITEYGRFAEHLATLVDIFDTEESDSLVILGPGGCGKSTLADRAIRRHLSKSRYKTFAIKLNGYIHTSDESTIQLIAKTLAINSTKVDEIISYIVDSPDLRLIIVLDEFEQFCRRQQSLLYNLFHLNQHAQCVCIITLAQDLECLELLEKRVRSRLKLRKMDMSHPYTNRSEYLEFASQLLGDYPIQGDLAGELMDLYSRDFSIRGLKGFLATRAKWNGSCLDFNVDTSWTTSLAERLSWLSKSQLKIIKLAIKYCSLTSEVSFSMIQLSKKLSVELGSETDLKDLTFLRNIGLISLQRPGHLLQLTQHTLFTLNLTASDLSLAISEGGASLFPK